MYNQKWQQIQFLKKVSCYLWHHKLNTLSTAVFIMPGCIYFRKILITPKLALCPAQTTRSRLASQASSKRDVNEKVLGYANPASLSAGTLTVGPGGSWLTSSQNCKKQNWARNRKLKKNNTYQSVQSWMRVSSLCDWINKILNEGVNMNFHNISSPRSQMLLISL